MSTDFSIEDQNAAISARQIAELRWKAIEAFNGAEGLSPMGRRVGIALIGMMDSRTRACFPSEQRLADSIGVDVRSIRRAKQELRAAYLMTWMNPGGARHLSRYLFNWQKLLRLSDLIRTRAAEAAAQRREARGGQDEGEAPESFQFVDAATEDSLALTGEDGSALNDGDSLALTQGVLVRTFSHGQQDSLVRPTGQPCPSDRTTLPSELYLYLSQDRAQREHDAAQAAERSPSRSRRAGPSEAPQAPRPTPPPDPRSQARCPFPSLASAFTGNAEVLELIERLSFDNLAGASSVLAKDGPEAAEAVIRRGSGRIAA